MTNGMFERSGYTELLELADWLSGLGVTAVAMHGLYWKPVYNQHEFELMANARHIKAVPGRKTT